MRPALVSIYQFNSLQLHCDHLPALSQTFCKPSNCQQAAMSLAVDLGGQSPQSMLSLHKDVIHSATAYIWCQTT